MTTDKKHDKELIKTLLRQQAIERAMSSTWNIYSLAVIYSVLIIIVLLELLNVNNLVVVSIAVLGLTSIGLLARIQAQRINKRLQKEEKQEPVEDFPLPDTDRPELALSEEARTVLSRKEFEVLLHLVSGKSNKEIAKSMEITTNTTKNHITHIFNKLGVFDRTSLVVLAMQKGWVKPSQEKTPAALHAGNVHSVN